MPKKEFVEIQEPAIKTIGKNRSCLKRSCFGGCGCLFIVCIIFLGFIRLVAVPNTKELKTLPETFPSDLIPMYDKENINSITYLSAQEKGRSLERLAYIPKILIAPLYLAAEQYLPPNYQILSDTRNLTPTDRFKNIVARPIFANDSTFTIHWTHLTARPSFILEYYTDELTKNGFNVIQNKNSPQHTQEITFTHNSEPISGILQIVDPSPIDRGTDEVILELHITSKP